MKEVSNQELVRAFEIFKNSVFAVEVDLRFWEFFLKYSIEEQKGKNSISNDAIFCANDIVPITNQWVLKCSKDVDSIKAANLESRQKDFFAWVANFSILRVYNALEIFLLQAIKLRFFPTFNSSTSRKKESDFLKKEIQKFLKSNGFSPDTKNNRHIIQFLKQQVPDLKTFLELPIREDLTTNWERFFELISILRNVISHHGAVVDDDVRNRIQSRSRDVFQRHFTLPLDDNNYMKLLPNGDNFLNFLAMFKDMGINCAKIVFDEQDFGIFKMTRNPLFTDDLS